MCTVTITGIRGLDEQSGSPTVLEVEGTADDCEKVCVRVRRPSEQPPVETAELQVEVAADGSWVARFESANGDFQDTGFRCGADNKGIVDAHCCDEPGCADDLHFDFLQCGVCPDIAPLDVSVADQCNDDGTRTVSVSTDVTPPAGDIVVVQIVDEDGIGPQAQVLTGPGEVSAELALTPGDYEVRVVVVLPEGCDASASVPVVVPPCLLCPTVTVEAEVGECDGRGRRAVTVRAVLEREDGGTVGGRIVRVTDATGDDEIGDPLALGSDADGHVELTGTASFDGGQTIWVKVEVTDPGPGLCGSVVRDIDLAPCVECPEIEWDTDMGDRCDERGRRRVFVTARVQGTDGQTATGRLLHEFAGTETERDSGSDTDGSLLLEDDQMLAPGNHRYRVDISEPRGCEGGELPVTVPPCGGGAPQDDEPQGWPCWLVEILGLLFFFGGMAALIGGACSGVVPVILVGTAAMLIGQVLLIVWAFLCAGCNALRALIIAFIILFGALVLTGSILLGIGAITCGLGFLMAAIGVATLAFGLVAAYFTKCG